MSRVSGRLRKKTRMKLITEKQQPRTEAHVHNTHILFIIKFYDVFLDKLCTLSPQWYIQKLAELFSIYFFEIQKKIE